MITSPMKKITTLCAALFISTFTAMYAQNSGTRLYYGGAGSTDTSIREFVKVRTLADGSIIHAGQADEGADANFSITKTLPDGTIIWQKVVGTPGLDVLKNFIVTQDGGFVLVGWTLAPTSDFSNALIVRLTSDGEVEWTRQFGGADDDEAFGATELTNGDLIISGTTFSFGPLLKNAYALRLTSEGEEVWCKAFAKGLYNYFLDAVEMPGNEVILCGYTWVTTGTTIFDPMFVRVDNGGATIWSRWIKMDNSQIIYDFERDVDGGVVFAGVSTIPGGGPNQNFISKINSSGNHQWTRLFGTPNSDRVWDMTVLPNGKYLTVGFAGKNTSDTGPRNGFISRLSASGAVEESILIGSTDTVTTTLTGVATSGDLLVANGFSYKNGHTTGSGILVQMPHSDFVQTCGSVPVTMTGSSLTGVDSTGVQSTSESATLVEVAVTAIDNNLVLENLCTFTRNRELNSNPIPTISPNPSDGFYTLGLTNGAGYNYHVFSADGKKARTGKTEGGNLDLRSLPDGCYQLRLEDREGNVFSARLVKMGSLH